MKNLAILLISLLTFAKGTSQDTLAHWGFNEGTGAATIESVSNTSFTINTNWPVVEWVGGVQQTAMRTDGYSVWAQGVLPGILPSDSVTISAWVAPEVYPVADAAIWSLYDSAKNLGAWVGIDKYGRLKVVFNNSGIVQTFTSTVTFTHYAWNYVAVNIDAADGKLTAYLNAVKVIDLVILQGGISWPAPNTKTLIGKVPEGQVNGLYPENTMNAIIDEVTLLKKQLGQAEISQIYQQQNPAAAPIMATPASRFAKDFLRPKYHPIPASNWCNEACGFTYSNGLYHMFYQKNGNGSYLYQQNWGHLVSSDLVTWQEVVPALWPTPGWDNYGIWSGHPVNDQTGNPVIIYTGVNGVKAGIGKATAAGSDLLQWQKSVANPVIPAAPTTYPNNDFRDPYVFQEGGIWYMIVGSGLQSPKVGTVFLYTSTDLDSWQFVGPMFSGNTAYPSEGIFWEMPVFWNFGGKHVLLVNRVPQPGIPAQTIYLAGSFANNTFTPDKPFPKSLELINWLLAPSVNYDSAGRVTSIGIIPDLIPSSEQYKHGYANVFSLPRVWLYQNDSVLQSPHPALTKLRADSVVFNNVNVTPNGAGFLGASGGFQLEISATVTPGNAQQSGLVIGKNPDNSEFTRIYYDYQNYEVVIDRQKSSTNPNTQGDVQAATLYLTDPTQPINWHVFIDGSVIEVFVNDRYAFASRYYPVSANSNGVDLFATGGNANADVKIWNLNPQRVLSVQWLSFTATQANRNTVQLQWQVSGETNAGHYDIERSNNAATFNAIGRQMPTSRNGQVGVYSFIDNAPVTGNNYYRIKQVDNNGNVTYSSTIKVAVKSNESEGLIQVIKNPAKEFVVIKVLSDISKLGIALFDFSSRKVFSMDIENAVKNQTQKLPLHGLAAGVYFLAAFSGTERKSYKILVQ